MIEDDQIRQLVTRLARPDRAGGHVVERAAILAEGPDATAILAWITAHGGAPEARSAPAESGGLHGARRDAGRPAPPPSRYLLPAGTLGAG